VVDSGSGSTGSGGIERRVFGGGSGSEGVADDDAEDGVVVAPRRAFGVLGRRDDPVVSAAEPTLRRLRPPRRPRLRRRFSSESTSPDGTVVSELSSVSVPTPPPEGLKEAACSETNSETAWEAMASNAAALCSKGIPGSGTGTGSDHDEASALLAFPPGSAPSRTAASWALVFQSARRKRSAAVLYHFAASPFIAEVSKYFANSKATMAS
jgi:hypothetical protein